MLPELLLLSLGLQSISWAICVLEHFCFEGQSQVKCPCCPQLKHAPCIPLWALTLSVLVMLPLDCPLPLPLQSPLGALVLLMSMGTSWLFHDFGAVVELNGVCLNPCHGGCRF